MNTYMKLTGIAGDVSAKGHEKWIAIQSMAHNLQRNIGAITPGNVNHRIDSVAQFSAIEIAKNIDATSPILYQLFCKGEVIDSATIETVLTGAPAKTYLQYILQNIIINSITPINNGMGERPYELLTLSYTSMRQRYTPYDATQQAQAPIEAGYDLKTASAA